MAKKSAAAIKTIPHPATTTPNALPVQNDGIDKNLFQMLCMLKARRLELKLEIDDILPQTGATRAIIANLEDGKIMSPSVALINNYAAALGFRPTWEIVPIK